MIALKVVSFAFAESERGVGNNAPLSQKNIPLSPIFLTDDKADDKNKSFYPLSEGKIYQVR